MEDILIKMNESLINQIDKKLVKLNQEIYILKDKITPLIKNQKILEDSRCVLEGKSLENSERRKYEFNKFSSNDVLQYIEKNPGQIASEIGRAMGLDKYKISSIYNTLNELSSKRQITKDKQKRYFLDQGIITNTATDQH